MKLSHRFDLNQMQRDIVNTLVMADVVDAVDVAVSLQSCDTFEDFLFDVAAIVHRDGFPERRGWYLRFFEASLKALAIRDLDHCMNTHRMMQFASIMGEKSPSLASRYQRGAA